MWQLCWEYLIYSWEVFTCVITILKYADNQPIKYILYSGFEMQQLGNTGRLCLEYQIYFLGGVHMHTNYSKICR